MSPETTTQELNEIKVEAHTSLHSMEENGIKAVPPIDLAFSALSLIANSPMEFTFEDAVHPRHRIYGEKTIEFLSKGRTVFVFKLPATQLIPDTDRLNFGGNTNFLTVVFEGGRNNQIRLAPVIIYHQEGDHWPTRKHELLLKNKNGKKILEPMFDLSTHPHRGITNLWLTEMMNFANTRGFSEPYFLANSNPKGLFWIESSIKDWPWGSKNTFLSDSLSGHVLFLQEYLLNSNLK